MIILFCRGGLLFTNLYPEAKVLSDCNNKIMRTKIDKGCWLAQCSDAFLDTVLFSIIKEK